MFEKVLVANRGEIAIRIVRTLREMGIASVAVYSELDRDALHVARADEAYLLGGPTAAESYLNVERILEVCRESGAEAVHPGYGFLAENAPFAKACEDAGITFIGPPASADRGDGLQDARARADEGRRRADRPGTTEPVASVEDARRIIADDIGFPVAVKAAGGGGGKGFRVALEESELEAAFEGAAREGEKFFSDATVYLERYLPDPRHVEVQVLADRHGNVIHLGERDCSVQRRHQKVIEESPAPAVDDAMRERIGQIGVEAARAVDYVGAGTIEGLLQDGEYFFLEMNTRVQVEHCVTEMVTGIDIVREGIRAAAGEELSVAQDDVVLRGHAIECRINAEDASKKFAPAPRAGSRATASPPGRACASTAACAPAARSPRCTTRWWPSSSSGTSTARRPRARMVRALGEYEIGGLKTLIPFHVALLQTEQWANGETCRDLLEDKDWLKTLAFPKAEKPADDDGEPEETRRADLHRRGLRAQVRRARHRAAVRAASRPTAPRPRGRAAKPQRAQRADSGGGAGADELVSPLQGNMWKVLVEAGQTVEEGQLVCIIEAMKMENEITAHKAGVIAELAVKEGDADRLRRDDRGHQERRLIAIRA